MESKELVNLSNFSKLKFLKILYLFEYKIFKTCRSKQECLELLAGENGEGCDVNPVVNEDSNESSSL